MCHRHIRPRRLAIFQALLLGLLISRVGQQWLGLLIWWKPFNPADVATLKEMIAAGKLARMIDRRYPLSDVVEALRYVDERRAKGKVVIAG